LAGTVGGISLLFESVRVCDGKERSTVAGGLVGVAGAGVVTGGMEAATGVAGEGVPAARAMMGAATETAAAARVVTSVAAGDATLTTSLSIA
jgi:hypothetical protein